MTNSYNTITRTLDVIRHLTTMNDMQVALIESMNKTSPQVKPIQKRPAIAFLNPEDEAIRKTMIQCLVTIHERTTGNKVETTEAINSLIEKHNNQYAKAIHRYSNTSINASITSSR